MKKDADYFISFITIVNLICYLEYAMTAEGLRTVHKPVFSNDQRGIIGNFLCTVKMQKINSEIELVKQAVLIAA